MAILKNTEIRKVNNGSILSIKDKTGETEYVDVSDSIININLTGQIIKNYEPGTFYYIPSGPIEGQQRLHYSTIHCGEVYKNDKIYIRSGYFPYINIENDSQIFDFELFGDGTKISVSSVKKEGMDEADGMYYFELKYTFENDYSNVQIRRNSIDAIYSIDFDDWKAHDVSNPATWILDVEVIRYQNNISLASSDRNNSIEIGYVANSYKNGISIGNTTSSWNGIAIGAGAKTLNGTNIGAGDQSKDHPNDICLGVGGTLKAYIDKYIGDLSSTSDMRDKIDFIDITKGLEFISKLKPVTYRANVRENYIDEDGNMNTEAYENGELSGNRRHAGFKAQEVYETLKEVYDDDNYAKIVDYSKYDHPDALVDRYYISMSSIIPFLVKAIQEQQDEINELKKLINELIK